MSLVSRSVRNLFRNKARTLVVVIIVGFALAIFLSASMITSSISSDMTDISENLETTISVQPAGSSTFSIFSGDTVPMNESILDEIWSVPNIDSVNPVISQILLDPTSTLRKGSMIQAMDPSQGIFLTIGGSVSITSGRVLDSGDVNEMVAMVGEDFGDTFGAEVGSTIYLNGTSLLVVGEFATGTRLGDNAVIIPYEAGKVVYNFTGMHVVYVAADSIGMMESVIEDLRNILGDEYDVAALSSVTSDAATTIQDSIDAVVSSSRLGAMISLGTAGTVMTFVMILVTRERTKEIGILKAIGFKNSRVTVQLLIESMSLASIGFVVGLAIAMVGAPYIANLFAGSSTTSDMGRPGSSVTSMMDLQLSPDLAIYTMCLTLGLGILGSLYPIVSALRLKPAEALRYD